MAPCYAIIPAAGSSRRMGQHKLLLPWPANKTSADSLSASVRSQRRVIDQVLEAWTTSRVSDTIVVIRRDDLALIEACRRWPVTIVHPAERTVDMKASLCVGLRSLIDREVNTDNARCFIAPADLPGLSFRVIDGLIDAPSDVPTILTPRFGWSLDNSISGHPVLLPWEWIAEIFALSPHEGVDAIVRRHPRKFVLFPEDLAVMDINTPEEYHAALGRSARKP